MDKNERLLNIAEAVRVEQKASTAVYAENHPEVPTWMTLKDFAALDAQDAKTREATAREIFDEIEDKNLHKPHPNMGNTYQSPRSILLTGEQYLKIKSCFIKGS